MALTLCPQGETMLSLSDMQNDNHKVRHPSARCMTACHFTPVQGNPRHLVSLDTVSIVSSKI